MTILPIFTTEEKNKEWHLLLEKLVTTHTYSIHTICQALKCSRNWYRDYISPNISDKVRISNKYASSKKINWLRIANDTLKADGYDVELTDITYLNSEEFDKLILENITATQQTKLISVDLIIPQDKLSDYQVEYDKLQEELKELLNGGIKNALQIVNKHIEINALPKKYASPTAKKLIDTCSCNPTKRGEVKELLHIPTDCLPIKYKENNLIDYEKWLAPHDVKNYGDVDETIYRKFFANGYIKIKLTLPNADGTAEAEKVFYIEDNDNNSINSSYQTILVRAVAWDKYKEKIKEEIK